MIDDLFQFLRINTGMIMATADDESEEDMMIDEEKPHTKQSPDDGDTAHCYALQVSMAEYNRQITVDTQEALKSLKSSPEFKAHVQKCHR